MLTVRIDTITNFIYEPRVQKVRLLFYSFLCCTVVHDNGYFSTSRIFTIIVIIILVIVVAVISYRSVTPLREKPYLLIGLRRNHATKNIH